MSHCCITQLLPQNINTKLVVEEEQTTQWPKEKVQKDKQRSTKHTHKTKDRVTRQSPLKTGDELRCSGRGAVPTPLAAPVVFYKTKKNPQKNTTLKTKMSNTNTTNLVLIFWGNNCVMQQ
jgi:hypothetical protein